MRRLPAVLLCLFAAASPAAAADVDYLRQVKPVLKARCFACHGALKQEASLRLDAGHLIRAGGDSGPAIVPEKAGESLLLARIADPDPATRMPPEGEPLTADQIALIRAWIAQGAAAPADERPEADPRAHWAFRRPVRPPVPTARNGDWGRNPIDAFIAAKHAARDITPLPPADKARLLRRVTLDLTGLPPTRDALHAFLAADAPDAYERVVDRLLDSPHYGERWGRHWMDVWRYSDWYGRRSVPDVLNSYGQIWRWRDWIVRSLNEDKGYDRMVREMLAADELAPDDDANLVATGYLVRNFYRWNYNTWMKDNVEHTGKAFLGLTFNCCQCHDHKYDPISQEEYFRFRAFFEPLELRHDRVPGEPDPGPFPKYVYGAAYKPITSGMVRIFDEELDAETYMYSGGEARNIIPGRPPVSPGGPALLGGDRLTIAPIDLPPTAWYPGLKPFVQREETARREAALQTAQTELAAARRTLADSLPQLVTALQQAETHLSAAREQTAAETQSAALIGTQSLVLDATTGRRVLGHRLPGLGRLENGAVVSYRLKIVKDTHTNLQLGLDVATGATGGYTAFDTGRIQSYRPGTFEVFDVGRYEFAEGQTLFDVRLVLDFSANRAALTVTSVADGAKLVDAVPVALNGWHPAAEDKQGLFLDARPGSVAVYDEILFSQDEAEPRIRLDFEPPVYTHAKDVVTVAGWTEPPFSAPPATSRVSRWLTVPAAFAEAEQTRHQAQRRVDAAQLTVSGAEAKVAAAEAELAGIRARIPADQARYIDGAANAEKLSRAASRAERLAHVAQVRWNLALAEQQLAAADGLSPADAKRAAAVQQASQKLAVARSALAAAETTAEVESTDYTPLSPQYPRTSSGRRAALARWITDTKNPLTARVAVNHIWLRHFGQGLVATPANFGRNGAAPTHPELLDWLAVEFMESGWSMKHLHRLIVTSATYRQSSSAEFGMRNAESSNAEFGVRNAESEGSLVAESSIPHSALRTPHSTDPDNVLLWRFPTQRLEAEAVRDSILHVAGTLDHTLGGPEIDQSLGLTTPRRSLYFAHHGERRMPFLDLFDAAAPAECYQRTSTIRPQQALAMTNAQLPVEQGRLLARSLWKVVAQEVAQPAALPGAFVRAAFEQVLTRAPTAAEAEAATAFLREQATFFAGLPAEQLSTAAGGGVPPATDPAVRARENLVQALFSHNDFITIR